MFASFRLSMAWLHTWFGLVLGFVLMVVFFFGALSVFDREIDRWAMPATRFAPQPMPSFDRVLAPIFPQVVPDPAELRAAADRVHGPLPDTLRAAEWWAYTTHRDPVLAIGAGFDLPDPKDPQAHNHVHGSLTVDPRNGQVLTSREHALGSAFFYPLHYSLHLQWKQLGTWIVGLAALAMLVALVSGVVLHRRLLRELFTFRPRKQLLRSLLDLHNLTGVVALPFHFMFALTGLVIFANVYLPVSETQLHALHEAHEAAEAARTGLPHRPSGVAAPLASVDAMVAEAQRRWAARDMPGQVGFLHLNHLGDSNGTVSIYRAGSDRVALVGQGVHFQASSGRVLREDPPPSAVQAVHEFVTGLHLQHFEHWPLRWLYLLGGLAGCACIATGFLFFVEKRKRQHAAAGSAGARWVDALAVAAVTGMLLATAAVLLANRLLPEELADRGLWERRVFWCAWLLALAHAAWRSAALRQARLSPAWREQCWALALLAVAAVVANAWTTGHHLLHTLRTGLWPVAGVDLALLATAALALLAVRQLQRRAARGPVPSGAVPQPVGEVAHG